MRDILDTTEIRRVIRNGKMYEFGHRVEPEFIRSEGENFPALHTLWARVLLNGYEWRTLHYYVVEGE